MKATEFANKACNIFRSYFPNGYHGIRRSQLGKGSFYLSFGMIETDLDCINKIRENDQLRIMIAFHGVDLDNTIFQENEKIEMEFCNQSLSVKTTSPLFAMESVKFKGRKTTNTPAKILAYLDKYFSSVRDTVRAERDKNNIYRQDSIQPEYLEF